MDDVINTFKTCSKREDGLISYAELAVLMETVDPVLNAENFKIMMEETGAYGQDRMKFEEFVGWLSNDRGPPEIIKAGGAEPVPGAEEENDDEKSLDGEDMDRLDEQLDLIGIDLDLDKRLSRKEWVLIMKELEVDAAEANELFDDITEDCVQEGKGNAEEGFPLREFLQELRVEIEDLESLRAIGQAAERAKAKMDQEEEAPPADSPQVLNPALDRVVRELDKAKRPASDAWAIVQEGKVPLSKVQKAALGTFGDRKEELESKVKDFMASPPMVNAAAGQNACRELCTAHVKEIVDRCKAEGTKFVDTEWDVTTDPTAVLYVDKQQPGWDCTVGKPAGYKRLTEIVEDPVLFRGGVSAGDIIQGSIGTCFLLGAMGAVVANNENALRKCFVKHDVQVGVYAVRFCLDGEWTYVVVDDLMPVNERGGLLYAHSKDPQEVWVAILEKAFCKLHSCYEMCDGGISTEAIYNFFGGVTGNLAITEESQKDPAVYFKRLKQARSRGWLLTTHFAPKKGAMAGAGKCGEATFESGLVGGHCYSVLRVVEAGGNQLVCCRNPWGQGEWRGKWSDSNAEGEWTDAMKEATGFTGKNDGKFWMCIEDFLANAAGVRYARPFGPNWKKLTQYKSFSSKATLATALWTYNARAGDEVSIEKGSSVEVQSISPGWWYGQPVGSEQKGYFPGNYVRLDERPVACFELLGTKAEGVDLMTVVVLLTQPASTVARKFYKKKPENINYKDTRYPCISLCIVSPEGKVHVQKRGRKREVWTELKIPGGENWRIYAYSVDGSGSRFVLRTYIKDGVITLKERSGDMAEITAAMAKK